MNVLAATMRRVERQLLDMDPPPQLIDTHELVIEAVTKLHTGFDMAASGARQKRTDLVNAATAEIQAGTALVVAARQSVPEGGC